MHRICRVAFLCAAVAAACGDDTEHRDAPGISDAGAESATPAQDAGSSCTDLCAADGPACDPSGSNRIGTCTKDPLTGCRVVTALTACASGSPVCIAGTTACVMAGYVVAPNGSDDAPGTLAKPFATLRHARDVVRSVNANMTGDIVVYLRAGDHRLTSSDCTYADGAPVSAGLCLDERDSGTGGFTIRYASYDGLARARVLGADVVSGWAPYNGGIYRAPFTGAAVHDLYEDGVRAVLARTPNINADYGFATTAQGPYFETAGAPVVGSTTQLSYDPADLGAPPSWNVADAHVQVEVWSGGNRFAGDTPNFNWLNDLRPIVAIDTAQHTLTLRSDASYGIPVGSRYFVQGDLSFLDAAGEYFIGGGYVYYEPRKTPIESREILAAQTKSLFMLCPRLLPGEAPLATQGTRCGHSTQVHDIAIEGLTLQGTNFTVEWPDRTADGREPSGMIHLEGTRAITIRNNHLENAGQHAIAMMYGNDANVVYGNWIEDSGISAVFVSTLTTYTGQPASGGHLIANNDIQWVGMHQAAEFGIHVEGAGGTIVEHNRVRHAPRALLGGAIDAVAPAKGTYWGYDDLAFGAEDSADTAPFYIDGACSVPCAEASSDLAHMPLKIAEQLRIDGAKWHSSSRLDPTRSIPPWGFYLDDGSSNWSVRNILVTNVAPSPINDSVSIYHGGTNITEQNVSWGADFDASRIDGDNIGLLPDFPFGPSDITWVNDTACVYDSGWTYRNDVPVKRDFHGDEHFTNLAAASVTCAFTGSEVRWAAATASNSGSADVIIDGALDATVDLASFDERRQRVVYRRSGLGNGPHKLTIVARGDRQAAVDYVVVDAVGVR